MNIVLGVVRNWIVKLKFLIIQDHETRGKGRGMKKQNGNRFCQWWNKVEEALTENEIEKCTEMGDCCDRCQFFVNIYGEETEDVRE